MPKDGAVVTVSGVLYKWIEDKNTHRNDTTMSPVVAPHFQFENKIDALNRNLEKLISLYEWEGKYDVIEESIESNLAAKSYAFRFYPRTLVFYADQRIGVMLNEKGNPVINLNPTEMPYTLNVRPGMYIDRVVIRFHAHPAASTSLRIILFG